MEFLQPATWAEALHPIPEAFLLARNSRPSDTEIREALVGTLCRCMGSEKILDAVRLAAS